MIAAAPALSQDRLLRFLQLSMVLVSSVVVVAFLRFHLESHARGFREEFERQSFVELSRGETFLLARKLAAVGKAEQVACIKATKGGVVFYEERNSSCETGLFAVQETVHEPNQDLGVRFTLRLPSSLLRGLFAFLAAQLLLGVFIVLSQLRVVRLGHEHELELAAQAQQVAHDIRSPLAVLRATLGAPDSLARRALDRLDSLVGHLQGEPVAKREPAVLAGILGGAVEEKRAELGAAIDLEWRAGAGELRLPGDSFEWRRLFSNLLNNAVEAGGVAPVRVTAEAGEGGRVAVSVTDAGKGMSPEALRKLGRRGFTEGKERGRGLGFHQARRLVDACGGTIEARSSPGAGTTIRVEVPASAARTVVLVDDDRDLALAWRAAATRSGIALVYFEEPERMRREGGGIAPGTPVYLDLEFPGGGLSALELGAWLHGRGFRQLFLCTGRAKSSVTKPEWAVDVVGKTPPWL